MQEHSYLWHSRRLPRYVGLVTPGVVLPRPATHTNVTRGLEGGPQAERDAWMKIKAGVSGNAMKTLSYRNSIDRAHVIRIPYALMSRQISMQLKSCTTYTVGSKYHFDRQNTRAMDILKKNMC